MDIKNAIGIALCIILFQTSSAWAEGEEKDKKKDASYAATIQNFRNEPATAPFFESAVAYAVFPTIGKGGIGIGGAFGNGRAYQRGIYVGDVKMGQVSIGWQFGGQAYSEIIFFQNNDIFKEFTDGDFEFGADASAVALTAGAQASASTKGATASAGSSAEKTDQANTDWNRGMAVFTLAKGGLMVQAAIGGQGFDYTPVGE
jgi:lipid-binding SYLF domain-containing protein